MTRRLVFVKQALANGSVDDGHGVFITCLCCGLITPDDCLYHVFDKSPDAGHMADVAFATSDRLPRALAG